MRSPGVPSVPRCKSGGRQLAAGGPYCASDVQRPERAPRQFLHLVLLHAPGAQGLATQSTSSVFLALQAGASLHL
eukprot:5974473-Lingulodinium_polyedra.AAC.1